MQTTDLIYISGGTWTELAEKLKQTIRVSQLPRIRKYRWWNIKCDQAVNVALKHGVISIVIKHQKSGKNS